MSASARGERVRHLVLVLGDQLDPSSSAFDGFDSAADAIWMAEVEHESTKVWTSKPRIAMFIAAMRHFAAAARVAGRRVHYRRLGDGACGATFHDALLPVLRQLAPERVIVVEPGEHSVAQELRNATAAAGLSLEQRPDRHFLASDADFAAHAAGRAQLRMEYFYREMRRRLNVLVEPDGQPVGGRWNFDPENRGSFGRAGPPPLPRAPGFAPDAITREALVDVERHFASHPGSLHDFDWPVTAAQAKQALSAFVEQRLPRFGEFQDAMWMGEPFLFHARISAALNLKLLDPREVVAQAEAAWRAGRVPLAAAEGFIRQIIGWREYVRGVYRSSMPGYLQRNALGAVQPLPAFYWTGRTQMACLRECITQTLERGYAHHIQRLMVTGLFALLLGVAPRALHEWYLAVYVDAVEWVELPNTLGMSQYADGGVMASKPYVASGRYIDRMSNYCKGCRYDPAQRTGARACPFTTLYWDFLLRHEQALRGNRRMDMQLRNLQGLDEEARHALRAQAARLREQLAADATTPIA